VRVRWRKVPGVCVGAAGAFELSAEQALNRNQWRKGWITAAWAKLSDGGERQRREPAGSALGLGAAAVVEGASKTPRDVPRPVVRRLGLVEYEPTWRADAAVYR